MAGKATNSLVVNSNNVIVDDIWAWRADHGSAATGWTVNTANTGLLVNGANVLATGLFVEHYQQYQVLWNGENGKTIFFQNEMPYDVPSQAAWTSGNGNGWAAYKVGANVKNHEAWGLGSYCFFNIGGTNTNINAARAFEVPDTRRREAARHPHGVARRQWERSATSSTTPAPSRRERRPRPSTSSAIRDLQRTPRRSLRDGIRVV